MVEKNFIPVVQQLREFSRKVFIYLFKENHRKQTKRLNPFTKNKTKTYQERQIILIAPCDMATHSSILGAENQCCRCFFKLSDLTILLQIIEVQEDQLLSEIAKDNDCSVFDLIEINKQDMVTFNLNK